MRTSYWRGKHLLVGILICCAAWIMAASLAPHSAAAADQEQVLHSFCSTGGDACTNGAVPQVGLIMDSEGNLYGTTFYGGAGKYGGLGIVRGGGSTSSKTRPGYAGRDRASASAADKAKAPVEGGSQGGGTVFALIPNKNKTAWTYKVIYNFCSKPGCADGANPIGALIMDKSGNLYGTTEFGGYRAGTVFELKPNAAKTAWTEKVLYSFCSQAECTDGTEPYGSLLMDSSGNLYGTTSEGGAHNGGTAFELTPNPAKTAWTYKPVYSFCPQADCPDGVVPLAGLIMDASGNLYGTTLYGGAGSDGTVFQLKPNANKTVWTEYVLYSFCVQINCADGQYPNSSLVMDKSGKLYGTVPGGGAQNSGAVFVLTPASTPPWTENLLYSFCKQADCADGLYPYAGLMMDKSGNFYGTTEFGGGAPPSQGVAFELTPNPAKTVWTEKVLYSFCAQPGCTDGAEPNVGTLIMDASGNLYGMTFTGGRYSSGTVFMLKP